MKCLVTGATGFLGTNLVHELVNKGWEVRALRRPGSETKYIKSLPIEFVVGDVTNLDSINAATQGMDVVFNVAGDTSFWKQNYPKQRQINAEGPVNVAQACLNQGVRKLIHTSTCDVLGYNPAGTANEAWSDYNFGNMGYNYGDTKREGEKRVLEFNNQGLEVIVINPGSMMGPYDHTLQFGRLFFELRDGKLPGCPSGGGSFNHVREVAKAHIAAAEKGKPGERYLCCGHNITYRELFNAIAKKFGKAAPKFSFPAWVTVTYGSALEFISNFTHKPPELNPGMARYMSVKAYYDSSKAMRELDYKVASITEMINDAYSWYQQNGFL